MKKVILSAVLIALTSSLIPLLAAEEGEGSSGFGAWRLSVGGALNGGVRPSVRSSGAFRGLAVLPDLPAGQGKAAAAAKHTADGTGRVTFGDGGYINPNSDSAVPEYTSDWQLTKESLLAGAVEDNYVEPGAVTEIAGGHVGDSDQYEPGVSVELSRTLWSDKERGWGVDLALAASYFFGNDIYDAHGTYGRSQSYETGKYRTEIDGAGVLDDPWGTAVGGYYGIGSATGPGPLLPTVSLSANPTPVPGSIGGGTVNAASSFDASGDYRELEMLFMLRPWYEIKDWWRVYAEVGVGVSWGRFDASFHSEGISAKEKFTQWDCYGVAGLGTVFLYDDWTLGIDFLGRFWRDDLDVDGRYVSGSIERSDWGFRVMIGYEF